MQSAIQPSLSLTLRQTWLQEIRNTLWGVLLVFVAAQISIPLQPVPITLGTFGVLLVGLSFKPRTAVQIMMTYLILGGMGLPVFAGFSGGMFKFVGPTAGYLFGYLAAILLMGSLRQYFKQENFFYIAINCILGTITIYAFGVGWLAHCMGLQKAIQVGLMPFILPGIFKILLLSASVRYLKLGKK